MLSRQPATFAAVMPIVMLLAFSVLFAAVAIWRFDWEEPRS